ncbi:MAG: hypothetical protein HEQ23_14030 [Tepidisphaera sp.]
MVSSDAPSSGTVPSTMNTLERLFDTSGFPARWNCGLWSPELGWLHIVSDVSIFLAYAAIPAALGTITFKRRDVPLRPILVLFIAFILSCGLTHLTDALMFYHPAYRLLGVMKLITATVSLVTAFVLIRSLRGAVQLPRILESHRRLQEELPIRRETEAKLLADRAVLEARSAELTARERRLTAAMVSGDVAAVRWNAETNEIEWEMRAHQVLTGAKTTQGRVTHWSVSLTPEQMADLRARSLEAAVSGRIISPEYSLTVPGGGTRTLRMTASAEPHEPGTAPMMVGMFRVF